MDLHKVLIKLFRTHRRRAHDEFNRIGLTEGQPKVLDFLVDKNGCIQKEIAENCKIEPATVTSLLLNMEKKQLICRSKNSENRRVLNVFLTDKGMAAQKQVANIFDHLDEICLQDFSEEEKITAIKLLNRIQNNLERNENDND